MITTLTWAAAITGCGGLALLLITVFHSKRVWYPSELSRLKHAKCTRCRGGMQTLQAGKGWARIPDSSLLLHRRPDSEGGDSWGSPQANAKPCSCCNGLGQHLTTDPSRWSCPPSSSEALAAELAAQELTGE